MLLKEEKTAVIEANRTLTTPEEVFLKWLVTDVTFLDTLRRRISTDIVLS